MKNTIFNPKEYLITAALNIVSLIMWFLPAIKLDFYLVEGEATLSELADLVDVPVFGFFGVIYIIMNIVGILLAVLPLIKANAGVAAIPDIKDGLFVKLQGAPLLHAVLVLFWFMYISNESRIDTELTFAGILAVLVGIGCAVWNFMLSSKLKKSKNASANSSI